MIEPIQITIEGEIVKIATGEFKGTPVGRFKSSGVEHGVANLIGGEPFYTASLEAAMTWAVGLAYREAARMKRYSIGEGY